MSHYRTCFCRWPALFIPSSQPSATISLPSSTTAVAISFRPHSPQPLLHPCITTFFLRCPVAAELCRYLPYRSSRLPLPSLIIGCCLLPSAPIVDALTASLS
ncbi:hypothetical protein BHM03_00038885 [Ensete ventricosum]|nr:hypothetical protein BHM03_00038885 [Ensete ventricosum]